MAFTLSRIDRKSRAIDVAAKFPGVTITGATVALLPPLGNRGGPTAATVWAAATYANGVATVLLAGPDADSTGALVVSGTADLWVKVASTPEVDAELVERITVLGGSAPLVAVTPSAVVSVNDKTGSAVVLTPADVGAQPSGDYATNSALTTGLAGKLGATAGVGGALSGNLPNPGLNETVVDNIVAADVADVATATGAALRAASGTYSGNRTWTGAHAFQGAVTGIDAADVGAATPADVTAASTADRARANHTGTQPVSTLSDLTEAVQDIVAAFVVAGTGVTVTYDDVANTYTINATATGGTTDPEVVRDVIGTALVAGSGIQVTVNDAGDTITIASTAVLPTRSISTTAPLTGGGDLSANRTLAISAATDTAAGVVELATTAETTTGTDTTRAVTPAGAAAAFVQMAPPPSGDTTGATDQAALQPLITAAQAAGQSVQLREGTYHVTGLATSQSFVQPLIRGMGYKRTTIRAVAAAPALKLVGGSGQASGGVVSDLSFTGVTGSVGLVLEGTIAVSVLRVRFADIPVGLRFANSKSGDFTEFCVARECAFESTAVKHIEYVRTSGNDSFHGTGFHNCIFVQAATDTAPKITVGTGCKVYSVPLDGTFFFSTNAAVFIQVDTTEHCHSFGNIRTENSSSATTRTLFGFASSAKTWHHGGRVNHLTQNVSLGGIKFRLVRRIQSNDDGSITAALETTEDVFPLTTGGNDTINLDQGSTHFFGITLIAGNYEYNYLLYVWRNVSDNNGTVVALANPRSFNVAGYGAPTFTVNATTAKLAITNAAFPASGVTAYIAAVPINLRASNLRLVP